MTDLDQPDANQKFTASELSEYGLLVAASEQASAALISYRKSQ